MNDQDLIQFFKLMERHVLAVERIADAIDDIRKPDGDTALNVIARIELSDDFGTLPVTLDNMTHDFRDELTEAIGGASE